MSAATDARGPVLVADDGTAIPLATDRFHAEPTHGERTQLARVRAPVIDVGCGPGRHVVALAEMGRVVLGVDTSPVALAHARRRGGSVLQRSIFDRLPGEGRWQTALLFDGNVGIGGDPAALLRRVASLLRADGEILVEVESPGVATRRLNVRLDAGDLASAPFPWAAVGVDGLGAVADEAELSITDVVECEGRWYGWLRRA